MAAAGTTKDKAREHTASARAGASRWHIALEAPQRQCLLQQLDAALEELRQASEQTSVCHDVRDFFEGLAYELTADVPYEGRFDVGYAVGFVEAVLSVLDVDLDGLIALGQAEGHALLGELCGVRGDSS